MPKEKKTIITSFAALLTAAGVLTAGSLEAPSFSAPGDEHSPKSAYIDRAELDDEIPDEDGGETEEDEEEEKRRFGARKKAFSLQALPKLLAALLGGLSVKKIFSNKPFVILMIIAALIVAADASLCIFYPAYAAVRPYVLTLAASLTAAGGMTAYLILKKRRTSAALPEELPPPEEAPEEPQPQTITFIDSGGEFTIDPQKLHGAGDN